MLNLWSNIHVEFPILVQFLCAQALEKASWGSRIVSEKCLTISSKETT